MLSCAKFDCFFFGFWLLVQDEGVVREWAREHAVTRWLH